MRSISSHEGMTYESLREDFVWNIPEHFNIGTACTRQHDVDTTGLIAVDAVGTVTKYTFGQLDELSDRLANGLSGLGVRRGDRVGIVVSQSLETGLLHLASYKLGAVALPLAALFGPDALAHRLGDSGARVVVTTPTELEKVREAVEMTGGHAQIVVTDTAQKDFPSLPELIEGSAPGFDIVDTRAEDPAYLIYTSGTTGPPKGALHSHRSLFGHLPGFELYYEFFPQDGDVMWTPADWAWLGALMDAVIPTWYFGKTVLTADHDFDSHWAVDLMAEHQVTSAFLPPTALKMMRAAGVSRSDLRLRSIFTGGEALGAELLAWAENHLGTTINEGYGSTEANLVVGNCASVWPIKPGSMGRPIPGHDVRVLDSSGTVIVGEEGEIAIRGPDPVFMIEYWNQPDATREKFFGDWLLTGDLGVEDEDGYLWFLSRKDDVIISMAYRIGPGEIEESLMGHPAVAMCAVIGVPDEIRGEVPKAFVVVCDGVDPDTDLAEELQHHVRTRLAGHEVPRIVEFVSDLPYTATGKIMRRSLRERA